MCYVAAACIVDTNEVFKEFQKIYLKINISYYIYIRTQTYVKGKRVLKHSAF